MVGMQNLGVNSDLCLEKSHQNARVSVKVEKWGEATSVMSLKRLNHTEWWECLYAEYLKDQVISHKAFKE